MKEAGNRASGPSVGPRKQGHDYQAPWKYHITISKADGCAPFSELVVNDLSKEGVTLRNLPLGQVIWRQIRLFQQKEIKVYQYAIMPDHIHMLIHVRQRLARHLGYYIGILKAAIVDEWRQKNNNPDLVVFRSNYHDRIVLPEHDLNTIFQYIRQNPYRLAVRKLRPAFFQRRRGVIACGREFMAYGNLFHLRNPFKYPLIVHRADTDEQFAEKLREALYFACNGGVVVSAFISPREKMVRQEVEAAGVRLFCLGTRRMRRKKNRRTMILNYAATADCSS